MAAIPTGAPGWRQEITRYQWVVLFATTTGWALDGFDSSLFTLVAGPATADLLVNSGIGDPTRAQTSFYSGLVVTVFLVGWALGAVFFGTLADYIGRVRVLIIGVMTYSVFTALATLAAVYWQFAALRFLAGVGSDVELPSARRWSPRRGTTAIAPRPPES